MALNNIISFISYSSQYYRMMSPIALKIYNRTKTFTITWWNKTKENTTKWFISCGKWKNYSSDRDQRLDVMKWSGLETADFSENYQSLWNIYETDKLLLLISRKTSWSHGYTVCCLFVYQSIVFVCVPASSQKRANTLFK
jgi:hypothetical protein